ncbi:MAG: hypothetical protein O7H41_20730 [Planctomycetota bacterium]|nr:hypothetical protein [Planctomycetota bacterium]
MAVPLGPTIDNLSHPLKPPYILPGGVREEGVFKILIERPEIPGTKVTVNRVTALPTDATFHARDSMLPDAANNTNTFDFIAQRVGSRMEFDRYDQMGTSNIANQVYEHLKLKVLDVILKMIREFYNGDGAPPNVAGLASLLVPSQTITATGGLVNVNEVLKLIGMVTAGTGIAAPGPADALFMSVGTFEKLFLMQQSFGSLFTFLPDSDLGGRLVPLFAGHVPTYVGQVSEAVGSPATTSIYALRLKGPSRVRIVTAGDPKNFGITIARTESAKTSNWSWDVHAYVTVVVPEDESLAAINGITV